MERLFKYSLAVLLFAGSLLLAAAQEAPTGLMTDLLERTEAVWSGGYLTNLDIQDMGKAKGSFQCALIRSGRPSLGWIVPGRYPARQTAWQVILDDSRDALEAGGEGASDSVLWDSGWVEGNRSVAIPYGGTLLEPSKVYFWKVRVRTDAGGESPWSDIKAFRTAPELHEYSTPSYPLVKERQLPASLTKTTETFLADFGRDAFGQLSLTLRSDSGKDTAVVHIGERLEGGHVLMNPTTSARYQKHLIALRKGTHTYRIILPPDKRNTGPAAIPMPEYIGEVLPFRYCEIESPTPLESKDIVREAVSYPFDMAAASFSCSDPVLNSVWDLCRYSVKATSFTGLYVDGDRERIPYEADALISQLCHYGADREYTLARRTLEYLFDHPTWPTEWILQDVLIAWNDYLFTGDRRALELHYDILRAHCMETLIGENCLISTTAGTQSEEFLASINRKEAIRDIVDWPHSGSLGLAAGQGGEDDGFVYTDYNAVVNAYAFRALTLMGRIASLLGREDDAKELGSEAERMRKAFQKMFFDRKRGSYLDGPSTGHASLHTNMFALLFGLVPEKHRRSVTDFIVSRGMACSVYGAQFLLEALYEGGAERDALRLMTDQSMRSWHNMIRVGSTITLEAWDDSFKPNQDWNHLWGAAPGNVIPFRLMGVTPLEPGFAKVRIAPRPADLEYSEATIPTIRGSIHIRVDNTPARKVVTVDLPANMDYEADLPAGFTLESR